jgi:hypothetical protein
LVIGSPLTMQATVCACNGEPQPIKISAAAQPGERRCKILLLVMIIFAVSTDSNWIRDAGTTLRQRQRRPYWMPPAPLAEEVVLASVRRPICNMNAWLSTGGVVPAEYW